MLEFAEMIEQIKYEKEHHATKFSDLWSAKSMLRRTLTGTAVQICCQFTGISIVSLCRSRNERILVTSINGALGVIVTGLFITFILDRAGRKRPLIFGATGTAICLAIEAASNAKWGGKDADNPVAQQAGTALHHRVSLSVVLRIVLVTGLMGLRSSIVQRQLWTGILGVSE